MGNCNFKKEKNSTDSSAVAISKNLFNLNYIIGKGGFGKVIKTIKYFIITTKNFNENNNYKRFGKSSLKKQRKFLQ